MKATFYEGNQSISVGPCIPVPPAAGEVQIRVSHCGICGTDLHIYLGHMDKRVKMPQIMGHEMSGTIEALGQGVTAWKVGDTVTVRPLDACNECPACKAGNGHVCQKLKFIGIDTPGAMQALWTVPAHTLHRLPAGISMAHSALIEPIAVACHDVRLGEVKAGEYCVVLGGGPIGVLVALVAKSKGARVLVSEINPFRIELCKQLGLEAVDPRTVDLAEKVNAETGDAGADVVFEVSGSLAGAEMMTKLPRVRGRIVLVAIFAQPTSVDLFRFFWREVKLIGARVYEPQDFDEAIAMLAAGEVPFTKIITDVYPISQLKKGFEEMAAGGNVMKILLDCAEV